MSDTPTDENYCVPCTNETDTTIIKPKKIVKNVSIINKNLIAGYVGEGHSVSIKNGKMRV